MTLNLFQLQLQLAAFIINLEGVHQNLGTLPFSSGIKTRAQAHFTGKPLLSGKGEDKLTCRDKPWQTETSATLLRDFSPLYAFE